MSENCPKFVTVIIESIWRESVRCYLAARLASNISAGL